MLLKRKTRRTERPCPHCGQGMDAREARCGACGRRVRLETDVPVRERIDIALPAGHHSSRRGW